MTDKAQGRSAAADPTSLDDASALVLAAGGSTRFGTENKLLHRWRNVTLLDHVLDAIDRTRIRHVLVVTGHDAQAVRAVLSTRAVCPETVHNAAWQSGLASSLACGIGALIERPAVLVCLGDMPRIRPHVIDALLDAAGMAPDKGLIVPVATDRRGNPVLIRRRVFTQILALQGDTGARLIAERHPEYVLDVEVDDDGVLLDVDTEEQAASFGA